MIRSTLLAGNNIPESNLVFPDTTLELSACIDDYQVKLTALFQEKGNDKQSAHIVTLGLGPDAHIASLFPPLANHLLPKRLAEVVEIFHTQTEKFDVKDRISTSLDTIHFATLKIFFLTGAEKQLLWGKMLSSDLSDVQNYPALHVFAGGNTVAVTLFESSKL
jgi:6-phosphogluconolactonase/glucosamine-6-phosphate isomerase/deaminase